MKIFSIPDTNRFLNLVGKSRGDVTLHLPDGSQVELKRVIPPSSSFRLCIPDSPAWISACPIPRIYWILSNT